MQAPLGTPEKGERTLDSAPALEEGLLGNGSVGGSAELGRHDGQRQALADGAAAHAVADLRARAGQERRNARHHQRHLRAHADPVTHCVQKALFSQRAMYVLQGTATRLSGLSACKVPVTQRARPIFSLKGASKARGPGGLSRHQRLHWQNTTLHALCCAEFTCNRIKFQQAKA